MLKVEYIVNSILDSITWLLFETEGSPVWLVDCGDIEPIIDRIGNREIKGILLTHAHFDHIYGLPELTKRIPGCKIYTNSIGKETLADAKLNLSIYHESPLIVTGPNVIEKREGDSVPLFEGVEAIIYETPGHHPSCLTYKVCDYLFTGDALIPGCKVVTNLPKGNKRIAQESFSRIKQLALGKIICPGHQL